jgi:hypothetical protein
MNQKKLSMNKKTVADVIENNQEWFGSTVTGMSRGRFN